jgi:hypothetical protein
MKVILDFDASDPKSLSVLAALTAALTATSGAVNGTPVSRNGEARTNGAATVGNSTAPDSAKPEIKVEDVRKAVTDYTGNDEEKRNNVKALLGELGAKNVTALAADKRGEFLEKLKELN